MFALRTGRKTHLKKRRKRHLNSQKKLKIINQKEEVAKVANLRQLKRSLKKNCIMT